MNNQRYITAQNFSIEVIIYIAKEYGLDCEFIDGYTLNIKSPRHNWMCEIHPEIKNKKQLKLFHENSNNNKKGKLHYHHQRNYYDFDFMFNSIKNHDKWKHENRGKAKIHKLFDIIKDADKTKEENRRVLSMLS